MTITFGFKSDVGNVRQINEDSYAVLNRAALHNKLDGLLIVGDGLGGRNSGEVASRELVETMSEGLREMASERPNAPASHEMEQMLRDVIVRSNSKIQAMSRFQEELRGMATTCVAALVNNGKMTIANVGDSRIYLLRNGQLRQLTEDHSEVFAEVRNGNMTPEEARTSKFRNSITRAVGLVPQVRPDIDTIPLMEGDTLLLCSDGLHSELPDAAIAEILARAPSAQKASDSLVSAALHQGGRDNVTVVVMRYGNFVPQEASNLELDLDSEPDTDPEQIWREQTSVQAKNGRTGESDREYRPGLPLREEAPRDAHSGARTRAGKTLPGYAQVLIGILALAAIAEGVLLYQALHPRTPAPVPAVVSRPTDSPMRYDPVRTLSKTPFQSDFLLINPLGNPVAATQDGTLTMVTPDGQSHKQGTLFPQLPAEKLPAGQPPRKPTPAKPHADITMDTSGNIYSIDPQTKCIETYNSAGTRTNQDLGKGKLIAPTRLAVSASGNIYVIDDNHLKVIYAHPVPAPPDPPKGSASHISGAD